MTDATTETEAERRDALQSTYTTAYTQVRGAYHDIDDFRAKLLGFVPVVSGVGAFSSKTSPGCRQRRSFSGLPAFSAR